MRLRAVVAPSPFVAFVALVAIGLGALGCEAVPSITFADFDAADGADADAAAVTDADAALADDAADAAETSTPSCEAGTAPPPFVCCGPVLCSGACTGGNCSKCQLSCGDLLCCARPGIVQCRPLGSTCP